MSDLCQAVDALERAVKAVRAALLLAKRQKAAELTLERQLRTTRQHNVRLMQERDACKDDYRRLQNEREQWDQAKQRYARTGGQVIRGKVRLPDAKVD